jgi:hypothetical protein
MRKGALATSLAKSSFGADLARFARKSEATVDETFRSIYIELFTSVISDTPVDQGRARGSWQITIGEPAIGQSRHLDKTGPVGSPSAKNSGAAVAAVLNTQAELGDVVWLTSNLPYIEPLEYGHSQRQAPKGMVRKNMARIQQIVKESATKAKGKVK